ncbi:phage tail protein [Pandoraea sputorum]|uniref:phage tail protein n=1 Tax=Pandoraea sputorum TaxID=93222 RepID=UPI002F42C6C6
MAALSQLDVINACLDTMGESPINSIDLDHPLVAAAINKLNTSNTLEQSRGWWFNKDLIELVPDSTTGFIYLPADQINVETAYPAVVARGRRLYDRTKSTYDMRPFVSGTGGVVQAIVVREIPFADLPMMAQHVVCARTALDFQAAFDGDRDKYNKLGGAYQQAFNVLSAENIRNERINFLNAPSVLSKLRLISPVTRYTRRGW